jgi:hypothetical protein
MAKDCGGIDGAGFQIFVSGACASLLWKYGDLAERMNL